MPWVPADRLARCLRLAAVGILAIAGILRMPDPGRDAIAAMVREAENLAYLEAFRAGPDETRDGPPCGQTAPGPRADCTLPRSHRVCPRF